MASVAATAPYHRQYADLGFEREGLFAAAAEWIAPATVVYPGCSVHVTPSFRFAHVVYIDRDPAAAAFFARHDEVMRFINSRKRYPRPAYVRFIAADYAAPLPELDGRFDLLLSLYAPGVVEACGRYLKPGGRLLTHDGMGDATAAAADPRFQREATIVLRGDRYVVEPGAGSSDARRERPAPGLRGRGPALTFRDTDTYTVFRRGG